MGLFNTEENISKVPVRYLFKKLPDEVGFIMTDNEIWIVETETNQTSPIWVTEEEVNQKMIEPNRYTYRVGFETVCEYYDDIRPVIENFKNDFDKLYVETGIDKTIPEQFGDIMKSYLPEHNELGNLEITPTKYFIAFNNDLYPMFKSTYQGYCLRHKLGQRGFDINPDDIGYLHVVIKFNGYDYKNTDNIDRTIHWFYPLAPADKDKS